MYSAGDHPLCSIPIENILAVERLEEESFKMKNVSRSSLLTSLLGWSGSTRLITFFPFVTRIGFLLKDVQPQLLTLYIVAGVSKSTAHSDSYQHSQQSLGFVIHSTLSTDHC